MSGGEKEVLSAVDKLKTYGEQLVQVEALLMRDPGNHTVLSLKRDLLAVISSTKAEIESRGTKTSAKSSSSSSSKKGKYAIKTVELDPEDALKIPEGLKILPTDSEKAVARKKKRIKVLKRKQKKAVQEKMQEKSKQSWKSFQAKQKKRRFK